MFIYLLIIYLFISFSTQVPVSLLQYTRATPRDLISLISSLLLKPSGNFSHCSAAI